MDVFDELAKYYDLIHENKNYEKESAYINGLIQKYNPSAKTILDIGCGTGNYAFAMQKLGYEVEGVDSSSQMIDIANSNNHKMTVIAITLLFFTDKWKSTKVRQNSMPSSVCFSHYVTKLQMILFSNHYADSKIK